MCICVCTCVYILCVYVYMHMHVCIHSCMHTYMGVRGQFERLSSFQHMGSEYHTLVIRLENKCPHPLSHLTGPSNKGST